MPILLRSFNTQARSIPAFLRPPREHHRSATPSSRRQSNASQSQRPPLSSVRSTEQEDPETASDGSPAVVLIVPVAKPPPPSVVERIRALYRRLHLNYLIPLAIILFYMLLGAFLFLWLEKGQAVEEDSIVVDQSSPERKLLLKRLEEILEDRASRRRSVRKQFLKVIYTRLGIRNVSTERLF